MKRISTLGLVFLCISFTTMAYANAVCRVANLRGGHWVTRAPTLGAAQSMAKQVCDTHSVNPNNCNPVCSTSSRWRCVVSNKRGQHWSFSGPTQQGTYDITKNHCNSNSVFSSNCQPICSPE